jgi:GntR family transcriptional repressor for pyruvate dehydrogenase complex
VEFWLELHISGNLLGTVLKSENREIPLIQKSTAAAKNLANRSYYGFMSSTRLKPVERTTLTATICQKLASELIRGNWSEGQKIPTERELASELGVGRASLREALKALQIMGMIEIRLGDGTYVRKRSEFFSTPLLWAIASSPAVDIEELVAARKLIEVELAGLAAEHASPAQLKEIRAYLDRMKQEKGNPDEFIQADLNFHLAIGNAASNGILLNALQLIRNLLHEWMLRAVAIKGVYEQAYEQHERVLLAIKNRDEQGARKAMRNHLDCMAKYVSPRKSTSR